MPTSRRALLQAAALLLSTTVTFAQISLQVSTDKGTVEGTATTDGKVVAFKGIPYAAPPVGDLRWAPPAPAESWTGVRPAKGFGYHCEQTSVFRDMMFHDPGASEDCLTLNVWTPANGTKGKLPVMVWIYGGGLQGGATSEGRQDGQFLAHKNVVVVSMNYRLGIFGFFVHPELTAESSHHASGNYGLMDQNAAIQWVKRNIAAFGGDPDNITLFGESAGSFSVNFHVASPMTRDLIKHAIGESGGAVASARGRDMTREQAEKVDTAAALSLYGTSKLSDLRALSTEDIMRPILAPGAPHFTAVVDGWFLPKSVADIYAAGEEAHIPVLAGWNADEVRGGITGSLNTFTSAGFASQAQIEFPTRSDDFLKLYPHSTESEALRSATDYAGDKFIAYGTWKWLESQVATGQAPVYHYLFALPNPGDRFHTPAAGAYHSDDIEYVFGSLDSRPEALWRPEDRKLSNEIQSYWTNFAKTGDPNGPGLPKWPKYGPTEWQTMHLDQTSAAKPDSHRERYLFLDSIWGKPAPPPTVVP
ncbi:MAG: carboxylesterase family protein [Edaphobacter sp.]|uniref:carboxylesterase/lipase family protein n=1 Tax=Edaphobacter sp. TaxID=1934404 RepID=UPI00238DE9E6|nr:carboxylesterase family protein [Edaphobacter sp.]MDE1176845.1 carboxylesterase family protein [Edaphobacter sp.]